MPPRIDRNARARLLFHAEALDRRTHLPGQHGGVLKRTGLAVLKALLFSFANAVTARCDPGYDALARAAGVARSTVAVALQRLEAAGLLTRIRRQAGRVRYTNAYRFPAAETLPKPSVSPKSGFRTQTTTNLTTNYPAGIQPRSGLTDEPKPTSRGLMLTQLARVRAALREDYEAIVRNRRARAAAEGH
jgi:DNA-binding transcriptional ArsR family regulator